MQIPNGFDSNALRRDLRTWATSGDTEDGLLARVRAVAQLLDLALALEAGGVASGGAALEDLDGEDRARLGALVRCEIDEHAARLEATLSRAEAHSERLRTVPLLADDPAAAEALQAEVARALDAREAIHRLGVVVAPIPEKPPGEEARLAALDARLRALLPHLGRLDAVRTARAAGLPESVSSGHWWYTAVPPGAAAAADEDEDDAAAERALAAARPLVEWVAEHVVHGAGGPTLRLPRDEARALLASERGLRLAEYLGPLVDLSAAELDEAERAAALAGASVPVRPTLWERLSAALRRKLAPLWETTRADLPEAELAADSPSHVSFGAEALTRFHAHFAHLRASVGVVLLGRLLAPSLRDSWPAWLVIPAPDVVRLAAADESWELRPEEWSPGVVVVDAKTPQTAALTLAVTTAEDGGERTTALTLPPQELTEAPDPVVLVVRFLARGRLAEARDLLASVLAAASDAEREALRGLEELVTWAQG